MKNNKQKIKDIKSLINEFYHDMKCRGLLTGDARKCQLSYLKDCDDIEKELEKLSKENKIKNLEYNKWYPIEEYFNNIENLDWALVQFKERYSDFHPLPIYVEYIKRDRVWVNHTEHDRYIVEMLEPVAFMLIKPYEEVKDNER